MKLTLIQPDARRMAEDTFRLMEEAPVTDLVVTTEAVNFPGQTDNALAETGHVQPLLERFAAYARERHCYVAACLYVPKNQGICNTITLFDRQGQIAASYDKIHLAGTEQQALIAGSAYQTVDTDFGRLGLCICWDMQFPEVCRHYALQGCQLVICPTWGWEDIYARSRAYENGIWVAGAMSVPYPEGIEGIRTPSSVIAPDGTTVAIAPPDRPCALTAEIDLTAMRDLHTLRMHDRRPDTYGMLVQKYRRCGK